MKKIVFLICLTSIGSNGYEYPRPIEGYYSQRGQDKFLNEVIFKNMRGGFFVEVGAHDGISFSNTYFFEKNLEWTGICVEPNSGVFEKLCQNRSCYKEQCCISDSKGQKNFLKCKGYILEMYSGLLEKIDPRHLERIDQEIATYGGSKEVVQVNTMSFKELFQKYNVSHVDLLSIDIEGGEEAAIKTIDFNQVVIDVIVIENNFNEDNIRQWLESHGYCIIHRIGKDDIYKLKVKYEAI